MNILIKNGHVWQGTGFSVADIQIADQKIVRLGNGLPGEFEKVIDAKGKYVLPGIIDCHVHLSLNGSANSLSDITHATETTAILTAVKNAEKLVRAGITTIRECGGVGRESIILKKEILNGNFIGPRIITCGQAIKTINGHFLGVETCGPQSTRRIARELIRDGADFIKIMATGGLGKVGEKPNVVELDVDEMQAAALEGKKHDMPIVIHCHSKQGILNALAAGATSIEHGTFLDQEAVDQILEHDAYLTPTFSPYELIAQYGPESGLSAHMCDTSKQLAEYKKDSFHLAYDRGVKISFGRDAGAPFVKHEDFVYEMKAMEGAGMSPKDIIISATKTAAKANHIWDITGSIEAGKSADIMILPSDPTIDLSNFCQVETVLAEGNIIRS
jgi:imidazolonepropionase-like amidohydrolase